MENNEEPKISRNAPCPCGSGKKYKMCCGAKAVAEEREAKARESKFWTPEGVTAEPDTISIGGRPVWTLTLDVEFDEDIGPAAQTFINQLIKPYVERHCCLSRDDEGVHDEEEIFIIDNIGFSGEYNKSCPMLIKGRRGQLFDMLLDRIRIFLDDAMMIEVECRVRWDDNYGGPIVEIKSGKDSSMIFVSYADTFGEEE